MIEPRVSYEAELSDDRMSAFLCVRVRDEQAHRTLSGALAALEEQGIVFGVLPDAVDAALASPGLPVLVARGASVHHGRDGRLEPLVDLAEARRRGVPRGTAVMQHLTRIEGLDGTDVTGRAIAARDGVDPHFELLSALLLDNDTGIIYAAADGALHLDESGGMWIEPELVLGEVDAASGDIDFFGDVTVTGSVHEGRHVVVSGDLDIAGDVDRSTLVSGRNMRIAGSVLHSTLRVGGDGALGASVMERLEHLPEALEQVAQRALLLRAESANAGEEISYGLSIQLVLEEQFRAVLPLLREVRRTLASKQGAETGLSSDLESWHRQLATAANSRLSEERFLRIVEQVRHALSAMHHAVERTADLSAAYVQACEVEATGTVTITGRGVFNSTVAAWGGLVVEQQDAVVRGATIASHGEVRVPELGSPRGAATVLQLADHASIVAQRVYAGTVVESAAGHHQFSADRTHVTARFDGRSLDVQSLSA